MSINKDMCRFKVTHQHTLAVNIPALLVRVALRSRAYCKPERRSCAKHCMLHSGSLWSCCRSWYRVPPAQYSVTSHRWFGVSYQLKNSTTHGCLSRCSALTWKK